MNISFNRPVFIGAHPDDICLGCGGLLSKLRDSEFYCYTFTSLNDERREEWRQAMDFLKPTDCKIHRFKGDTLPDHRYEIRKILEQIKDEVNPDVIFTHSPNAVHQSHLTLAEEVERIMRYKSILGYAERHARISTPKVFMNLSDDNLNDKIKAISHFESESWKHFLQPELIKAVAMFYGSMVSVKYAEGYDLIRMVF